MRVNAGELVVSVIVRVELKGVKYAREFMSKNTVYMSKSGKVFWRQRVSYSLT